MGHTSKYAVTNDKVAIVTGGASGIGKALCEELSANGVTVIVADINAEGAAAVASEITAAGGRAEGIQTDVSDGAAVDGLVDNTVAQHNRLDYMFNNAGIDIAADFRDITAEQWRRFLDINLMGVLHGSRAAYRFMAEQGSGCIVNTASLAGLVGCPTSTPYATTKSAIVGFSTSLRVEAEPLGVKVCVVCPGYIQTAFYDSATVLNADRKKVFGNVPFKMMEARAAARVMLRGVARNKAIITFPFHARLAWWIYRLNPSLLTPLGRQIVRDYRRVSTRTPEKPRE